MFGTVARMRLKPGHEELFQQLGGDIDQSPPPGFVSRVLYRSVDDPNEIWLAVVFESEQAYRENAASPQQNEFYQRMVDHLEGAPEWHDGEVLAS